jgi:glycosyltransferase involved in cell wall biosynthesis
VEGRIKTLDKVPGVRKLYYLLLRQKLDETTLLGVKKKVLGQLQAFNSAGIDARLIDTPFRPDTKHQYSSASKARHWQSVIFARLNRNLRNAKEVLRQIESDGRVFLYVRYTRVSPGLLVFFVALNMRRNVGRIYLEIPTWPFRYEGSYSFTQRVLWPILGLLVQRVVTFSRSQKILGVKTINITNGVSSEDNPLAERPGALSQPFKLVYVGQLYRWSGLDRLIRGLGRYEIQGCPLGVVELQIAGTGIVLESLKDLAHELSLNERVRFFGNLTGNQLESIYFRAFVGVGNLANHRRRLDENADLKNREYCMRGIPFVTASDDPAFKESFAYRLKLPPDESDLDITKIIEFQQLLATRKPEYPQEMRAYALNNLQWRTTLLPVIKDMEQSI